MKKISIFGAGKIGRSFIGQLFSLSNYEVVFIDIHQPTIDGLNKKQEYKVVIKAEVEETIMVKNVRGVMATDVDRVVEEVATSDILAMSVGQKGMPHVAPLIAKGLLQRQESDPNNALDIIIAENMRDADKFLATEIKKHLPADYPFEKLVGLVETSIGKMVPIMSDKDLAEDPLQVFAEPYNSLVLDQMGFKNPIPKVNGLAPKENMKAWVDRKSFIHNLGHAAVSYIGYLYNPNFTYLWEALQIKDIFEAVKSIMQEASDILMAKYPGEFLPEQLNEHIDDLLYRFQNKALGDTIYRVGCDLPRKLSTNDRLAGAIHEGLKLNKPVDSIIYTLLCGYYFKAKDTTGKMFPADEQLHQDIAKNGLENTLKSLSGLSDEIIKNYHAALIAIDEATKYGNEKIFLKDMFLQLPKKC